MKESTFTAVSDGRIYREGPNGFAEVWHKADKVWCYSCVTINELRANFDEYQRDRASARSSKTASYISHGTIKGDELTTLWRKGAGYMAEYFETDGGYWRTCKYVASYGLSRASIFRKI